MRFAPRGGSLGLAGRSERAGSATIIVVCALACAVGALTSVQPGAAAAVGAVLALGAVLLSSRPVDRAIDLGGKRLRWVALAWAYVLIRPIGHYTMGRSTLAAVAGVPSVENVLDLATHGAIAVLCLWALKRNRLGLRPSWLILALPALALASAAWSLAPNVTLGFSFELVAICLLAMLTVAIHSADPNLARSVLRRALRVGVQIVALLCVVGLAFPQSTASAGARFAWLGVHPLTASAEIGLSLLVVVFTARGENGFSRPARIGLLVLFGTCLYLGQSRTTFVGLAAAGLFGAWFVGRGRGWARRLAGLGAIAVSVFVIASLFAAPITAYLYRGETHQQVFSFNGRLGLWTFALHQLHSPVQWLFGYGLGSTRVFLSSSVAWAGDAHGAWEELLVSLGLVGIAVAASVVFAVAIRLLRCAAHGALASRVLPILFVYVLAMSPVATGFAIPGPEPGLGFAVLALCYAGTAVRERAPSPMLARRGVRLASEARPAPI